MASQAQEYERVLNFHSDIRVDTTGRVNVTETIKILVTGESIKRGIVRSIPIYRKDKYNLDKRIDIQVDSVFKNGEAEPFSAEIENKDFAIYIGESWKILEPNIYEYTIKYWSGGHVGFFDGYDEIYWNVNGNDWAFDIDSISATVYLPQGTKFINNACYTGLKGSCSYQSIGDTIVKFWGNSKFSQHEGLTIATSFTPNIIKRPKLSRFGAFMQSDGLWQIPRFIILVSLILLVVFLIKINTMNGRPIVIPTFEPPYRKSAASLRYLYKQKSDNKAFMACLVSMAVKKAIVIKSTNRKTYTLTSLGQTSNLTDEEFAVYNKLFISVGKDIVLGNNNTAIIQSFSLLDKTLRIKNIVTDYFLPKSSYITQFILLCISFMGLWFVLINKSLDISTENILSITIYTSINSAIIALWYLMRKSCMGYVFLFLFIIPVIIFQLLFMDYNLIYKYTFMLNWILIAIVLFFVYKVKPLTKKGVRFSTDLEGFKMYLSVAEENRLNVMTPPDLTPEQFEKMLPYAIALDLEIKWAKKFEKALATNYQPSWYLGSTNGSYVDFTSRLSKSFGSSIKSSATPKPTSSSYSGSSSSGRSSGSSGRSSSGSRSWSSGSSGRGSSGGGGGGGGGRGW